MEKDDLLRMCRLSPVERILLLCERSNQKTTDHLAVQALERYVWFLRQTAKPASDLEQFFSERENRVMAFSQVKSFGDGIFDLVSHVATASGTFRYLVV